MISTPQIETKKDGQSTGASLATGLEVKRNEVVQWADGRKYVAARAHPLPPGAKVAADRPHGDGDYSYICGSDWCRCSQ